MLSILEFVARVADKSNIMCESYQKKTISADHLEAALNVHFFTFSNLDLRIIWKISKELRKASRNRINSKDKQVREWRKCLPKTNNRRENVGRCRRRCKSKSQYVKNSNKLRGMKRRKSRSLTIKISTKTRFK
jgi:hypothetical protein